MDYPKSTPGVGLVNGQFADENPSTGAIGSLIPAAWGNAVTQEILAVITAAGLVPSEANLNQLLTAIQTIAATDAKRSVRCATTGAIALSGLQTIDGVVVAAGDRVLVKNQAAASQNWIYVASAGAWDRAADANESIECIPGHTVPVQAGTLNAGTVWQLTNTAQPVLGTTALTFAQVAGKSGVAAGAYNTVTVDAFGRVIAGSNPTTLAGHGIADGYTRTQVDTALAAKAPLDSPKFIGSPEVVAVPILDVSYRIASTRFVNEQTNGYFQLDAGGAGAIVLATQDAMPIIYAYGALTGDREVVLPLAFRKYLIGNFTTGAYKFTVRMNTGTGVEVTRNCFTSVFTDTVHTRLCQTDFINTALTGIPTAPKAAKGTATDQVASCSYVAGELADKATKATTLAGYGITDTYNAEYLNNWFAQKAAKATTLAGYGIADAYTAAQIDIKLSSKPNTEAVAVVGFVSGSTADPYFGSTTGELVRLVSKSKLPLNTCVRGVPGWWSCGDTGLLRQRVAVYIGDVNSVWTGSVTWPVAFPAQADSVKISIMTADGSVGLAVATYSSLTKSGCKIRVEEWGGLVQAGLQLIVEAEGY